MRFVLSLVFLTVGLFTTAVSGQFDREAIHSARFDRTFSPDLSRLPAGDHSLSPQFSMSLSDVAISESISPARFDQANGDLVYLADLGSLALFDDDRFGSRKIFWQRYDLQGEAIGQNVMIAGSSVGNNYVDPKLAVDTLGLIYLFYRDRTDGLIYGSRYFPDLTVDYSDLLVNDTSQSSFAGPFDFAVYPDGRTVVVWENYSAFGSTIESRIINRSGAFVNSPVTVNSDGGSVSHWVPSVSVKPASGFLVAWEDYRNGNADVYARIMDGNG
ncbi:MAG: hypothetical protein V3T31_01415, partial [candidate division Zixibacteria bacterium]